MIYITGDIHGNPLDRLSTAAFPEQKNLTKNDYVIICGDFGLIFNKDVASATETYRLNWLNEKPFTTLFVDGNHENFDRLNAYPEEEWNSGLIHKITPSVFHLMRGQVFTINGLKFFTFGGARSHDIRDGVLEIGDPRIKKWNRDYSKLFRVNHLSWWEEEMPNQQEMAIGLMNLEKHDNKVDFVISHDMPGSTLTLYGVIAGFGDSFYKHDELNKYFDDVRSKIEYKQWFCGHYHDNIRINDRESILYDNIVEIYDKS